MNICTVFIVIIELQSYLSLINTFMRYQSFFSYINKSKFFIEVKKNKNKTKTKIKIKIYFKINMVVIESLNSIFEYSVMTNVHFLFVNVL